MTETSRKALDALDLLMQDHRELEFLFREFAYRQQSHKDTGCVIAAACRELKMHDTLETEILYAAVNDAGDNQDIESFLYSAEEEHDIILDLIEKVELTRTDRVQQHAHFTVLAAQVQNHVRREEDELFPLVNRLQLDLGSITAAMKTRRAQLMTELGITEAHEETV
jgi:iron-sulfur cluster repair protein YtfE (RIC family)